MYCVVASVASSVLFGNVKCPAEGSYDQTEPTSALRRDEVEFVRA